ncbi:MAG TPA: glycosyltransferase family 4 protein [Thermoanaerobaculia bacterium]|nr:glycosyltransferase family 4 protein [Thermoanaerobaculia bacterium]
MRIAQVAPLYEAVPPAGYGGTERVVSYLTEELVRMGLEVTLFASGDSITAAELEPASPRAIRLAPEPLDPLVWHSLQLGKVARRVEEFDVLHFHTDFLHYPFSRQLGQRCLTTLHGRLDLPDLAPLYREFSDIPVISISNAQRAPLPWANWQATIYHGLPDDLFEPSFEPGSYLAFLGRLSPEKRPDWAIEIARRAGRDLRMAAKIDPADRAYYESTVASLLEQPHVEMVGEVGQAEKGPFLAGASALIFPVDWPEPFGLVMIEALACGTPVIAFRRGSIEEVIEDGVTGFVVDTLAQAVEAAGRIGEIDRRRCRREFTERFSARRMAAEYVALYERMIESSASGWVDERRGSYPASTPLAASDDRDRAPD